MPTNLRPHPHSSMPTRGTRALDEVPRPTPEQWLAVKDDIERLYVYDGYGLKEVASTLRQWHPTFTATERMFKSRIKKWNFDLKTIRRTDWQFMFQEYHRRINATTPKETIFEFRWSHRGARDIMKHKSPQHIRQYMRRKKLCDDDFLADELNTELFPHIRPRTPPLSPPTPQASPFVSTHPQTMNAMALPSFDMFAQRHLIRQSSIDSQSTHRVESPLQLPTPVSSLGSPPVKQEVNGLQGLALEMISPNKFCLSKDSPWHYLLCQKTNLDRCNSPSVLMSPPSLNDLPASLADLHIESEAQLFQQEEEFFSYTTKNTKLDHDELTACRWASLYLLASIQLGRNDLRGAQTSMNTADRWFKHMLQTETTCPNSMSNAYKPSHRSRFILLGLNIMSTVLVSHDRGDMLELFLVRSGRTINEFFGVGATLGVPYAYLLHMEKKMKAGLEGEEDDRSEDDFWEDRLKRADTSIRAIWGSDSPNAVMSSYYYAWHVLRQGRHVEAIKILETCFNKAGGMFGRSHMVTIKILETIARALEEQKLYKPALRRLEDAICKAQHGLSAEHPFRLQLVERVGTMYQNLGLLRDAEKIYEEVLEGRKRSLGVSHNETFAVAFQLAHLLRTQARHSAADRLLSGMDYEHYAQMRQCYDKLGFYVGGQPLMETREALEFH